MSLWGLVFATNMYEPLIGIFINEGTPEATRLEITRLGRWMLLCAAFWQTLDAVGIVLSGALRGAGDTTWHGVVMVGLQWSILMGCGYLSFVVDPPKCLFGTMDCRHPVHLGLGSGDGVAVEIGPVAKYQTCRSLDATVG